MCAPTYENLKCAGIMGCIARVQQWLWCERPHDAYERNWLEANVAARVSVEMASTFGWERYTGPKGKIIGMRSFGASAPLKDLLKKFGFNADNVVAAAKEVLAK